MLWYNLNAGVLFMAKETGAFQIYIEEKQKFIRMIREKGYVTYEITRKVGITNGSIKRLYYPEESIYANTHFFNIKNF